MLAYGSRSFKWLYSPQLDSYAVAIILLGNFLPDIDTEIGCEFNDVTIYQFYVFVNFNSIIYR